MGSAVRVLIVEDNRVDAANIQDLLDEAPYPVDSTWVPSLAEALDALRDRPFDAVLLDLGLPDTQGFDGVAAVRETASATPVIVLSAHDDRQFAKTALELHVQDYLVKGQVEGYLHQAVHNAMARQHLYDEVRGMNADLEKKNAELQALYAAKSEFLSIASHALRSPLASILGSLETCTNDNFAIDDAKRATLIGMARRNAQHMLDLVNRLLDMEAIDAGGLSVRTHPAPVANIVKGALEGVSASAKKHRVHIISDVPAGLLVNADPSRLIQVLVNLANNAIEHSKPNGQVRVGAEDLGDVIRFSVLDDGEGIPPDRQASLFERAQQDANRKLGGGLGLFICRSIVEQHGGDIGLQSAPGRGSRFYFTCPKPPAASAQSAS